MQPSYDSWDFEPPQYDAGGGTSWGGSSSPGKGFEDPSVARSFGLVDISKGKGKSGGRGDAGKSRSDSWDTWDTWEAPNDGSSSFPPQPPTPTGMGEVPRPSYVGHGDQYAGKGSFNPSPGTFKSAPVSFDAGKGKAPVWRSAAPDPFAKADSAGPSYTNKAAGFAGGKGADPSSKGKPGFSFKGKLAPRKADFQSKAEFPAPKQVSAFVPPPVFTDGKATAPSSVVPPPVLVPGRPGLGQSGPGVVPPVRAQIQPLTSVAPHLDGPTRGPVRPAPVIAPRLPVFRGDTAKGVPPRVPLTGHAPRLPTTAGLGSALTPVAVRGGVGATTVAGFRPALPPAQRPVLAARYVPPGGAVRPPLLVGQPGAPPPPTGPVPVHVLGQGLGARASLAKVPPALANVPHTVPALTAGPGGLTPELAALVSAGGEGDHDGLSTRLSLPIPEKKPRIYLLVTRLAAELEEGHLQQILEQCGEVQAFRRGRDASGEPLSFGFAQFGDPEAAWKVSTCLSKRVLCGQELKVLVEERAETLIQQWRRSQQAALRVSTDEELDWELERKAVSCKASIDAKVEEIFGLPEDGEGTGAIAQRRQELREKEKARIERLRKRKAWRDEAFTRELARVEAAEKRLRKEEVEKDDADRAKEEAEQREKEQQDEQDLKLSKLEDAGPGTRLKAASHADNRKLIDMVDIVQSEPRDELFRMELNLSFLRNEKILEKKLRPWLERKVDLCMGGPQSDLVEYILRRVNASSMPDTLISELTRYLDDNAEPLVERMWRMLAFELMRGGLALSGSLKKGGGQQPQPSPQGQRP
mmetsp:Transcript_103394/g.287911  ORF Transcript_103394/g.287911 Transcript_103394/m.287911 type:complete len:808 (+) Transcript_103394:208-2631(+)